MKIKKISVRNLIETLTDNELKHVLGGYGTGDCYALSCSSCEVCECIGSVGLWAQCYGADKSWICASGSYRCRPGNS